MAKRIKRRAKYDSTEKFDRFRLLIRRVWELVLNCDDHREVFGEFIPKPESPSPEDQMIADYSGYERAKLQNAFLSMYPNKLDCDDGCSFSLYLVIDELDICKAEIFKMNDALVGSCAKNYLKSAERYGIEYGDLMQQGRIGLNEGVERFDHKKGFAFSTYGLWWIRNCIIRIVQNGNLIRLPINQHSNGMRPPQVFSFNNVIPGDEDGKTFQDLAESESVADAYDQFVINNNIKIMINKLSTLSERDEDIVRMRFGLSPYRREYTLDDVGKKYNLCRERVRQIQNKILCTLRKRMAA